METVKRLVKEGADIGLVKTTSRRHRTKFKQFSGGLEQQDAAPLRRRQWVRRDRQAAGGEQDRPQGRGREREDGGADRRGCQGQQPIRGVMFIDQSEG